MDQLHQFPVPAAQFPVHLQQRLLQPLGGSGCHQRGCSIRKRDAGLHPVAIQLGKQGPGRDPRRNEPQRQNEGRHGRGNRDKTMRQDPIQDRDIDALNELFQYRFRMSVTPNQQPPEWPQRKEHPAHQAKQAVMRMGQMAGKHKHALRQRKQQHGNHRHRHDRDKFAHHTRDMKQGYEGNDRGQNRSGDGCHNFTRA